MRTIIWIVVAAGVALLAYFISNLVSASGLLLNLEPRLADRCTRVDVSPGTEDVTIDPEAQLAYISATDRRAARAGRPKRGAIFALDLAADYAVREVSPDWPADFQPHGISLWRGADGRKRLFVVNHPASGGHSVEIFSVEQDGSLTHLETVAFEAMRSPNDVAAVGPRQFYATNDRGFEGGLMGTLEAWLALPFSSVVYFDGENDGIVRKGLAYANGINVSHDGDTVYVAEFLRRRISVYDRDRNTGALSRRAVVRLDAGPDNIEVARDGALWVAGHPKVFDFLKHAEDPSAISPSHVARVNPETGDVGEVFVDPSGAINASSVGAVWDDTLIVGAVFDGHVMVCPMMEIFLQISRADR
ncbi:strictosidine synthase family protein [Amphiplicatus metriothermophilus]|uniref:Arylesterase / paraoxonase n=1 Tax=Amphiplicatus metriothermophilus TaxID=1519374 RepID=A0A239PWZ7_9PROT|nr:SMP-30/gluconolactonase/LRE family protein [Amphiplicatus metriothermophilus]MBB5519950.1 arylesterase/paraoxonase [Amphiplicatus metriothermophilus]SNT74851.1 arylesterase / paraoxonase [Amphiplicatus metriothermophilus]